MAKHVQPPTEGMINKGGLNSFPSQVTDRPGPPPASNPRTATPGQASDSAVRDDRSNTQEAVKHTPGPWEARDLLNGYRIEGRGNPMGTIAELMGRRSLTGVADARLIAAAPDMLVALKLIEHSYPSNKHIAVVRAAIAKAQATA